MQFVLTGFTQNKGFRVFAFERIGADRARTPFTVKTDLELIRKYGIRVQELPLLCRALLERHDETEQERAWIYSEEEMRLTPAIAPRNAMRLKRRSGCAKLPWRKLSERIEVTVNSITH